LRHHIALVSQMPVMFSTSIHENIASGKDDATAVEVMRAAKQVGNRICEDQKY
jgi:ABC-type multidrug transport system fused ATPase/permease subunit